MWTFQLLCITLVSGWEQQWAEGVQLFISQAGMEEINYIYLWVFVEVCWSIKVIVLFLFHSLRGWSCQTIINHAKCLVFAKMLNIQEELAEILIIRWNIRVAEYKEFNSLRDLSPFYTWFNVCVLVPFSGDMNIYLICFYILINIKKKLKKSVIHNKSPFFSVLFISFHFLFNFQIFRRTHSNTFCNNAKALAQIWKARQPDCDVYCCSFGHLVIAECPSVAKAS